MRLLLGLVLVVLLQACVKEKTVVKPKPSSGCIVKINNVGWKMEVARSEEERERGLMHRQSVPEQEGMIFVYPEPRKVAMWMKNTYVPLDMIFVSEALTVNNIHQNATPLSEEVIRGEGMVAYVLELHGGQAAKAAIMPGDRVDLSQCAVGP